MTYGADRGRATDDTGETAQHLHAAIDEFQELRGTYLDERRRHLDELAGLDRQIARLESDRSRLAGEVRDATLRLHAVEQELTDTESSMKATQTFIGDGVERAQAAAGIIQRRIDSGIPYRRQARLEKLRRIADDLSADDVLRQAGGLERFLTVVAEEMRLMNRNEIWNALAPLDTMRSKYAYFFRLGLVNQAFVTEDGETVGLAAMGGTDAVWVTNLDADEKRMIRRVMRILRQQQPPRIVSMPFQRQATDRPAAEVNVPTLE